MTFGENLKRIRKSKGLTQAELGEKIGVSHATIGRYEALKPSASRNAIARYESGAMFPKYANLMALTDALDCSIGDLFGEEPKSEPMAVDSIEIIVKVNGKEVMRWANQ